jgi:hypothetical protein
MPKVYDDLPMDVECLISGLPMGTCAHCRGDRLDDLDSLEAEDGYDDYEITAIFEAIYPGTCILNREHKVKRGDKVGRVRHGSNPLVPIGGVACKVCTQDYPKVRR